MNARTQRIPLVLLISCLCLWAAPTPATAQRAHGRSAQRKHAAKKPAARPVDEQALKTQVMLDRAGYSPGEINATNDASTQKALAIFTKYGGNAAALPSDEVTTYRLTDQDVAGPFTPDIPSSMMEMAKLDALNYKNAVEKI